MIGIRLFWEFFPLSYIASDELAKLWRKAWEAIAECGSRRISSMDNLIYRYWLPNPPDCVHKGVGSFTSQ